MATNDKLRIPPRFATRLEGAAFFNVSPGTFDSMVRAGTVPPPRRLAARRLAWDIAELNAAADVLPVAEGWRARG